MYKYLSLLALIGFMVTGCVKKIVQPTPREKDAYTLPDGARFKHPPTWSVREMPGYLTVAGPEPGFFVHVIEAPRLIDAREEALAMWQKINPAISYPVYIAQSLPAEKGFENIDQIVFDVPAQESRSIIAIALSVKDKTYWLMVDATNELLSRRQAELMLIAGSFRASGTTKEERVNKAPKVWGDAEKRDFREFIKTALKDLKVPGAAIMIVDKSGNKVFQDAMGVKDIATKKPVTVDTPFLIGSTTKSLTTFMMASLVDKNVITWETKLKDVLGDFAVADEELTNALDMRNSVSASTGMPRRDYEFIFAYEGVTAEERLKELSFMAPTTQMGETFQYSNHLVMAGGYAAAKAYKNDLSLEQSYDRAMSDLVFKPLGMTRTVIEFNEAAKLGNALPHAIDINGAIVKIPLSYESAVTSVAPAGGLWSTVEDLSRYVVMELNQGQLNGTKIIAEDALLERRKPRANMGVSMQYGLGLFLKDYYGVQLIGHNGNTLGFSSLMVFLPEQGLGLIILTNGSGANAFLNVVEDKFLELTFGRPEKAARSLAFEVETIDVMRKQLLSHVKMSKEDTAWMKAWKGKYENETLGKIEIKQNKAGKFILDCGEWQSELATYNESNGKQDIFLTSPPYFFIFQPNNETHALLLDADQQKYEFKPVRKMK